MNLLEKILKLFHAPVEVATKEESSTIMPKHDYRPSNRKISQYMKVPVYNSVTGKLIETRQL